jgi:hypothetical protein
MAARLNLSCMKHAADEELAHLCDSALSPSASITICQHYHLPGEVTCKMCYQEPIQQPVAVSAHHIL